MELLSAGQVAALVGAAQRPGVVSLHHVGDLGGRPALVVEQRLQEGRRERCLEERLFTLRTPPGVPVEAALAAAHQLFRRAREEYLGRAGYRILASGAGIVRAGWPAPK